ncbi:MULTISPECIES: lysozyme inhibitor LprI family protein [Rhizobium/Agrobacterium group]|uniref:lysozyme inhibitor LprI family protein n=1 Tax=Rhizobium/Agrobacterium group TaxID=227290 RepID=UPI000570FF55|nr:MULTISPECIES: lysozyme inhibitor LprI family protein [Rhizobium/Agrobacterium group]AKC08045.1 urease accessory protein [Agrobacterium tumefaciens]AYM16885.1 urease accessory protein [Agrobacterium tumefaciens]AYM68186.1 urease accessory protein [Agrobacterium tumefaciens]NIB59634.1 lysozyme inhibitor LprI family protein [Agrobacterium tumefaciens]NSY69768.1 lysozyme inhibitor LprI family protein [Agrobacterium tumefaciens]
MAVTLKKFCFGAAVLLSLAASPAFADDAPDCTSPQTQADMTICAGKDYEKADKQLNAAYQKVRKQLAERDKTADESGKGAVDALVAAQRAWVAFRDANCDAFGFQARGGTMEPMLVSSCLADMSNKRADELRQLSEGF